MLTFDIKASVCRYFLLIATVCLLFVFVSLANAQGKEKGPPPSPVQVAVVGQKTVSSQVSLIGTTEAISESTVASEISGLVQNFPIKEGDYVKKGDLLVNLKETRLRLRLKGVVAAKKESRQTFKMPRRSSKGSANSKRQTVLPKSSMIPLFIHIAPFPKNCSRMNLKSICSNMKSNNKKFWRLSPALWQRNIPKLANG